MTALSPTDSVIQAGVSEPVLILDVGSTSVKGAVIDGNVVAEARSAMPAALATRPGRHELDPDAVVMAVRGVAERLMQQCERAPVTAVMSTQMHTCLITDSRNLPISPVITWQDDRLLETDPDGASRLDRLAEKAGEELWRSSGIALRAGFGGGNLGAWLSEHPEVSREELRIHTLGSYLATQLSGPYATDLTNAASLGLVDVRARAWSSELAELHGLEGCAIPELFVDREPIGTIVVGGCELVWLGDVGDHQASVLGCGGLAPDTAAISMGTAGIAARLTDGPSNDLRVDSRPYFGGQWLQAVSRQPGGALASEIGQTLARLASQLTGTTVTAAEVWQQMSSITPAAGSAATLGVSRRAGAGNEVSLQKLRPESATADLQQALVRHYSEAYSRCLDLLFTDGHPRQIAFNGGFSARNQAFRNGLATELGVEVHDVPPGDLALKGLRAMTDRRRSA